MDSLEAGKTAGKIILLSLILYTFYKIGKKANASGHSGQGGS